MPVWQKLLHMLQPFQSSPCPISSDSGLADCQAFLSFAPASLVVRRVAVQQGPFAPWALPQFITTPNPSATLSPSFPFPVEAGYRSDLLQRFLAGARRVSPVARHALATVLSLPPRRSDLTSWLAHVRPCCLRPEPGDSASGVYFVSRPPVGCRVKEWRRWGCRSSLAGAPLFLGEYRMSSTLPGFPFPATSNRT